MPGFPSWKDLRGSSQARFPGIPVLASLKAPEMAERRCISGKGGRKYWQQGRWQQGKREAGKAGSREYGESEPMRRVGVEYSDNSRECGTKAAGKAGQRQSARRDKGDRQGGTEAVGKAGQRRPARRGKGSGARAGRASKVVSRAEGIAGRAQIRAAIRPIHY
jgi:hypothetical protein